MMTFDFVIADMLLLCVSDIYFVDDDGMILFLIGGRDLSSVGGTCFCNVYFQYVGVTFDLLMERAYVLKNFTYYCY